MNRVSRRSFLAAGAGAAAAGAAIVASPIGSAAAAVHSGRADALPVDDPSLAAQVEGAVIYVRNARSGEVVIMGGESEVVVTDRTLVTAVARAAKNGTR